MDVEKIRMAAAQQCRSEQYDLSYSELCDLIDMATAGHIFEALSTAFSLGFINRGRQECSRHRTAAGSRRRQRQTSGTRPCGTPGD